MREFPQKNELQAVKIQKRLAYLSYGCIVLLGVNLYLWDRGFSIVLLTPVTFCLLCVSLLARVLSVFRDGFFVRGGRIVRGDYGIVLSLARLGMELMIGVLLLFAMSD